MCGIAGFTSPTGSARQILADMTGALAHRGPDGRSIFIDETIALGHTRLAIIDLEGGAQPRVDEATGDALVFNGEIYGYRDLAAELRAAGVALRDQSDSEVLFHLIRRDGVRRTIDRVDGMFAFAFRDGATGTLYLARDRFGEKPLYYGIDKGRLIFASEVDALACHEAFAVARLDRLAAYQLLTFEYLPGAASGWEGISKLAPGTLLTFDRGAATVERYWQPRIGIASPGSEAEAVERLGHLLSTSVRSRLVADVPVGVFLSGGIDSSIITALAAGAASDLTAFTVRFDDQSFDETPYAVETARHLGVRHEIVALGNRDLVDALDAVDEKLGEPLADSSLLPTYLLCRAARSAMKVALGGDGADELFAGYPNFGVQRFAPVMRWTPRPLGAALEACLRLAPGAQGYMNRIFRLRQLSHGFGAAVDHQSFLWMAPFARRHMEGLWRSDALGDDLAAAAFTPVDDYARLAAGLTGVDRLQFLFLMTYLAEDILAKTDRASMFNSLEVRSPFLARELSDYACALPTHLKLKGWTGKHVLKKFAASILPRSIVHRKKHGFGVPIGRLIGTLFRDRCRDVLLSPSNPVSDWFQRAAIEGLLNEQVAGRYDHGKKLWALYILFSVAKRRATRQRTALPPRVVSAVR